MIGELVSAFSSAVWSGVLWLLLGAGFWLLVLSRGLPYRYFGAALRLLAARTSGAEAGNGELSQREALAAALSGTLGLGNIAGVADAISIGGAGAVFWMWLTALLGICTKFFTCTLAVLYRSTDEQGRAQGGPMYVIREALGPRWQPLAVLFAVAAMFGSLPLFQANQLVQIVRDVVAVPAGWTERDAHLAFGVGIGLLIAAFVGAIVLGGATRVGRTALRLVPTMVAAYLVITAVVLLTHAGEIPAALARIVSDAFSPAGSGDAVAGGLLGALLIGVRQGAFSNEAGIGTEALAHGAARTPIAANEGLVAMIGPVVDTLVVCTATALMILVTGVADGAADGVSLTAAALEAGVGELGPWVLTLVVVLFSVTTMFTFCWYGARAATFLFGPRASTAYIAFYLTMVVVGAATTLGAAVDFLTGMYGLMAIPTVLSTLLLAPKVLEHARANLD